MYSARLVLIYTLERVLLSTGRTTRRELAGDGQDQDHDIGRKGKKDVVAFSTYSDSFIQTIT
jgi:hypothetical protein